MDEHAYSPRSCHCCRIMITLRFCCIHEERGQPQYNIPIRKKKHLFVLFPVEKRNLSFSHFKTLLQLCQRGPLSQMQASPHSRRSHHRSDCDNDLKGRRCSLAKDETVAEGTVIITAAAVAMALQSSNRNKKAIFFQLHRTEFRGEKKKKSAL